MRVPPTQTFSFFRHQSTSCADPISIVDSIHLVQGDNRQRQAAERNTAVMEAQVEAGRRLRAEAALAVHNVGGRAEAVHSWEVAHTVDAPAAGMAAADQY